jgi:hypothetical protein
MGAYTRHAAGGGGRRATHLLPSPQVLGWKPFLTWFCGAGIIGTRASTGGGFAAGGCPGSVGGGGAAMAPQAREACRRYRPARVRRRN